MTDLAHAVAVVRMFDDKPPNFDKAIQLALLKALERVAPVIERLHFQYADTSIADRNLIEELRSAGILKPLWEIRVEPQAHAARIYWNGELFATCPNRERAEMIKAAMEKLP